jgi:hypothetical protein
VTADLVEFLRSRLDERQRIAEDAETAVRRWPEPEPSPWDLLARLRQTPAEVLAEVAALRAIIDACEAASRSASGLVPAEEFGARLANELFAVAVLRHLAAPHASHPDYQTAWSPNAVTP